MKEIIETILQNFSYIYPGFLFISIYNYIKETDKEDITLFLLKIVCVSYVLVQIIDAIWQLISQSINCTDKNIESIIKTVCLLISACILPFCAVRISKSNLLIKFLRWNNISIEPSKNDIDLIESKRPEGNFVNITVFLNNAVYTGVLINAESGDDGFFFLKHWKKYLIGENDELRLNDNRRHDKTIAVIPMKSVQHYYYEYFPQDTKQLPEQILKLHNPAKSTL